ncbi:hypothetical protein T4D_12879 [Trichinella pseudospiralis]|uniref:Uncharacterized protein n=1 Tax=Trichinella pseudospiralis TaxID=6337 RepID=A0A0V1FKV4_TRIPS|nr:hypothetical protein T4D_12879 [Trichinella pseudospiralis]
MTTKRERSHKGTSSCDDQPDNCELKSNMTSESKQFYSFRDSQLALLASPLGSRNLIIVIISSLG